MRLAWVLLVLCVLTASAARGEDEPAAAGAALGLEAWLTLAPVDARGRRPFNPDAVFERYLLDPRSPTPHAGDVVKGTAGSAPWTRTEADAGGRITGRFAWAYTRLDAPRRRVAMASLPGGSALFVNGTPHVGAVYGDAFAVPVVLRQGRNDVYVRGVRGGFRLTLEDPPGPLFIAPFRQTTPDLVRGEAVDASVGLLVVNASETPVEGAALSFEGNAWLESSESPRPLPIVPLGVLQLQLPLRARPGRAAPDEGPVDLPVVLRGGAQAGAARLRLDVKAPGDALLRTFVSEIDGSVQRYGLRRPAPEATERPKGLVLTLHGAGVEPRAQAASYAPKPDFWIVAPTNRDRFGFDWQDWGRIDAYEVLRDALRISGVDRRRVYLTGHSMGGHGTWHLAANDPDGFAAIAPSAGWIEFDTYPGPRPDGLLREVWHAADAASKTRMLLPNLVQVPTFILHGTKDDNVPVAQAREMEALLTQAGAAPRVHYEEGRGHWWDGYPEPGAQCVDWPGIFDLFRQTEIPACPDTIAFTTVSPRVDARHHWVEVRAVEDPSRPATVSARWAEGTGTLEVTTENVARLLVTHPAARKAVRIDGRPFDAPARGPFYWPEGRGRSSTPTAAVPGIGSPFRDAWTHRFVMVVGTRGTEAEDRALLEQARFDAQRWTYRANGRALLLDDTAAAALPEGSRRILYGNGDTCAGLEKLPGLVGWFLRRGFVGVPGVEREVGEDLAICMVLPGVGAIVGSTGVGGSRLGFTSMLFVSGAGWPDCVLFDASVLTRGDEGVLAAGWYQPAPGGVARLRQARFLRK